MFREGSNLVMFSSDVSARGLDYPDVTTVIQVGIVSSSSYDMHVSSSTYDMHVSSSSHNMHAFSSGHPDVTTVIQVGMHVSSSSYEMHVSSSSQVGMPSDRAQYIHRLGRTARAGKSGSGVLLLATFERNFLKELSDLPLREEGGSKVDPVTAAPVIAAMRKMDPITIATAYQAWLQKSAHCRSLLLL